MKLETLAIRATILSFLIFSFSLSIPVTIALSYNLTYDANGNRQSAFGLYHEYNSFNQLSRVRLSNSTGLVLEEYIYDSQDQRAIKSEPQKGQYTYYLDKSWIRIVNASGTFDYTYYYDGDTLVGRKDTDGRKFFYHPDHLGSTTLITNEQGNVVEEITYEPFGQVFAGNTERFGYTGKELDKGTGNQYFGARYYCVNEAQFCSPDSMLPDPYNPQALNRYAYTLNNPYKYTDPDGNVAVKVGLSASGSIFFSGLIGGGIAVTYNQYTNEWDWGFYGESGLGGSSALGLSGGIDISVDPEDLTLEDVRGVEIEGGVEGAVGPHISIGGSFPPETAGSQQGRGGFDFGIGVGAKVPGLYGYGKVTEVKQGDEALEDAGKYIDKKIRDNPVSRFVNMVQTRAPEPQSQNPLAGFFTEGISTDFLLFLLGQGEDPR